MSLQQAHEKTATNTTNIATNAAALATLNTSYPASKVTGTTTNDNATAGNIGEYIESVVASGSAVALTSATPKNVTSISLTAGDWDISAAVVYFPAATTSMTASGGSVSTVSDTLDGTYIQFDRYAAFVPANPLGGFAIPRRRASLSGTTTFYLVAQATFTVSTLGAYGLINARRVR
ncbi:hypothetical protein [Bradyrhizobium sp. CW1]|uniref:hypothetical protein n=1 Tax=Bradyrhizobium sp. CW1 TaxID=2782686 RepID=UPI0020003CE1|nr:hypothetical protein [Bradyrhizobium sp. CW1]UPJ31010.1 hypothetical protein IVB54_19395 [Bradyrhizobium sp. CW1]